MSEFVEKLKHDNASGKDSDTISRLKTHGENVKNIDRKELRE